MQPLSPAQSFPEPKVRAGFIGGVSVCSRVVFMPVSVWLAAMFSRIPSHADLPSVDVGLGCFTCLFMCKVGCWTQGGLTVVCKEVHVWDDMWLSLRNPKGKLHKELVFQNAEGSALFLFLTKKTTKQQT